MKPVNIAQFFQQLGQVMQETEQIGGEMHPYYEKIEQEIEKGDDADFSQELLAQVALAFEDGVDKYNELEKTILMMMAPAKLMILFKQFQSQYQSYVQGCRDMLAAVDPEQGFDLTKFQEAEKVQDEKSQALANTMTKMMRFIR